MMTIEDKLERLIRYVTLFRTALKNGKMDLAERYLDDVKDRSDIVHSDIQQMRCRK